MGTSDALINGWILPILAGPAIGSFLGVLIRRLPAGRKVAAARSACDACGHMLRPVELIPIASYIAQRGRCTTCGAPIDPEHVWVELAALGIAAASALCVHAGPYLWLTCALGWWLLALGWIDARTFRLPDVLTLPLILAGLVEAAWLEPAALPDRALAAATGFAALWLLAIAYRRLRGHDGLGMGDAKLLAAGGAWLGIASLPFVLFAGAALALLYALVLRLRGTALTATSKLPLGPFLTAAIWLAWVRP
jgi:leader peptidase (prepilin peptidase)/N-methyltransferase